MKTLFCVIQVDVIAHNLTGKGSASESVRGREKESVSVNETGTGKETGGLTEWIETGREIVTGTETGKKAWIGIGTGTEIADPGDRCHLEAERGTVATDITAAGMPGNIYFYLFLSTLWLY